MSSSSSSSESAPPDGNLHEALGLGGSSELERVWPATLTAIEEKGYELAAKPVVGSGATAVVLRAHDRRGRRHLALKVVLDPLDDRSYRQYLRENQVLGRSNLPASVVRYDGYLEDPRNTYQPMLVLEYIEARSLRDYLKRQNPTLEQRLRLCRQLLHKVASLHASGVLWADLSHNNILVDGKGQLRFIDFGVAGPIGSDGRSITSVDGGRGTKSVTAPEVLDGRRPEPRDDLRAAAAVCHLVLGGGSVDAKPAEGEVAGTSRMTRPRRDLLNDLTGRGVPRGFAVILVDALITAESPGDGKAPEAGEVAARLDTWFEDRVRSRRTFWSLSVAVVVILGLLVTGQSLWSRYQTKVAEVEDSANLVLAGELERRPNLHHPALEGAKARIEKLALALERSLTLGDANAAAEARRELVEARRGALELSHDLEAAEPLLASLGDILTSTPWEKDCPTIGARVAAASQRHLELGATVDSADLGAAWPGLRKLQRDLARLAADNAAAMRAAEKRGEYRRLEKGVAERLRELAGWQAIADREADAEQLMQDGRFDDSAGPGAVTEFSQLRFQLEAFLRTNELQSEREARMATDGTLTASLEERIDGLESARDSLREQLESVRRLLFSTETDLAKISGERDQLALQLAAIRDDRDDALVEVARLNGVVSQTEAQKQSAEEQVDELRDLVAAAEGSSALLEAEIASLTVELTALREAARETITAEPAQYVPAWAELIIARPDPKVVTDAEARRRMEATGLPWKVRDRASGIVMLLVPPGTYFRGASRDDTEAARDEQPAHQVRVPEPFYLAETEVTHAQWGRFVISAEYATEAERNSGGYTAGVGGAGHVDPGATWRDPLPLLDVDVTGKDWPVVQITWNDAQAFAQHYGLRLPRESEWEYACRANSAGKDWWGEASVAAGASSRLAARTTEPRFRNWTSFDVEDERDLLAPVGTQRANSWGFHDLLGNVWEPCSTAYDSDFYSELAARPQPVDASADDEAQGDMHVLRGGSWIDDPWSARASLRNAMFPDIAHALVGLRVARTP
ncbi:SUMF1/EgtB/PvdO family nonheme iron enzyme [Engelhardtia mirabilis]|uniref:Serine/threonine-protein kinase PknB n=1 Tax=Engelhardtia mirabilis TaxID=2528011 RepID=A0A518BQQ2_9BACT|nr:Serine/threonine-protein kinase PknB [Planctomycetes bacterium Pla133]QDV03633.1 Serine/threonine-protein kinase PknB [Planctomycetes bacterium Pla86]